MKFSKKSMISLALAAVVSFSLSAQNMAGYELKFEDNFDGKKLDESKWNYELHEPGWVNNELQSYIKSDKNVYLKGGNLIIQPLKEETKSGNKFTSGRINTQRKFDFKYGLAEARLKVPRGKGFLPAFWMMPTDESKYGSWPKCGEIDIMEVLGDKVNKTYATLHFGEPHTMAQKEYLLKKGNYADEFHTFACEWEPGLIKFYVDGVEMAKFDDWFTKKLYDDEEPYPAPYNQPFYLILNVAVGGTWPGYPDGTTKFDASAQMVVDYVRVYQKKSYNENVTRQEEVVEVRAPGADGNYIRNGGFNPENLKDKKEWMFMTQQGGSADAAIAGNTLTVNTSKAGTIDYSIQLVQADIPLERGYQYEFSFDAWSTKNRKMKAKLCAPDRGWKNYFGDVNVELTPNKKHYSYKFSMDDKTDPNARLDFNMGATPSTDPINIANVKLVKLGKAKIVKKSDMKKDKFDLIYNGEFAFSAKQWEFYKYDTNSCELSVDQEKQVAQITIKDTKDVDWKIQLMQKKIPLMKGKKYRLTFDAWSTLPRMMKYACQRDGALWKQRHGSEDWTAYNEAPTCELTTSKQTFTQDFEMAYDDDSDVILTFSLGTIDKNITKEHDVFLDNVKLVEIK
ncbi:carbohydrate binding domain-containing protein [Treponema sp.]|uniref:carbohydrate binding domain-containing protein n=1 Tax=Treponema sp. TaxID=166 RepID=UPI00298D7046|nr:carbohydrate binding domain-containing protein [Treponema sp.]MCQ2240185.1 family 16 glycosylhydrolase [Treponema sp.]